MSLTRVYQREIKEKKNKMKETYKQKKKLKFNKKM